jgi:inhibitor of cysteine peptidase
MKPTVARCAGASDRSEEEQEMKQPKAAVIAVCVLAMLIFTLAGCTVGAEVKEYRSDATSVVVEKGSEFAIVLESNPTTGYMWRLAEPLDEKIITLEKREYEEPETERLGASGEEKWTFKAQGLGETTISLVYSRTWEEEKGEAKEAAHSSTASSEASGKVSSGETTSKEGGSEATESPESAGAGEKQAEEATGESMAVTEEATTLTFHVKVVKKGSMDKAVKKYEDDSATIEVEQDLKFAVVLASNPTTGYAWRLAKPLNEAVVELVSTEYENKGGAKKEGEGEALGAGGEEIWTFLAVGAGETEIEFEYVRSWEKDVAPQEKKTFKVEVKAAEEESGH